MKRTLLAAAMLAASLSMAPAAVAQTESGSVSTGEADSYGGKQSPCPDAITTWRITLTLHDPSPTDAVALSAQGMVTTVADVATADDPTATVQVTNNHGCLPATQVTGVLVDGSVDYTLDFD